LEDALAAGPAGSSFGLRVERSGETLELNVSSAPSDLEGAPSLGVALETRDLQVGLPFEISFRDQDIAGPSAGLAFGLAIYDMLSDTDIARGRTFAATGRLDPSGWVGPVGGVKEKALAAQHAGASLFVVPGPQVIEAWAQDVPVRGASTLRRALALLGRDAR
jgi:PDZ domain-containing protein